MIHFLFYAVLVVLVELVVVQPVLWELVGVVRWEHLLGQLGELQHRLHLVEQRLAEVLESVELQDKLVL